jgi:hypothetical protein
MPRSTSRGVKPSDTVTLGGIAFTVRQLWSGAVICLPSAVATCKLQTLDLVIKT